MKITYRYLGGFVPRALGCELDSQSLPAEEAAELAARVRSSRILDLTALSEVRVFDTPTHVIEIETDGNRRRLQIPDALLPTALRPLVTWLRARSTDLLEDPDDATVT
jgi:hypothetical protein